VPSSSLEILPEMLSALHQSPRDYLKLAMDFLIRHEGRDLGPYSEAEVRSRLISGTIKLSDLCLPEGMSEWAPLSSFAQFATSYREPPAPPPAPPQVTQNPAVPPAPGLDPKSLGSYTAVTLQANERPLHHTTIHWMALMPSVFGAALALIFIGPIAMFASWKGFHVAWLLFLIPVGILLAAAIGVKTSELVITDRRVLIKVGFIRRHTFEMFISKIESVAVYQGMMGRIFNYGTVEIRGTGGSSESFSTIAAPLPFRDAIQLVQSESEKR
jgi:Bacterial PH domain/GYF domain 2